MKCVIYLSNSRANISFSNQILLKNSINANIKKLTIENPDINNIDRTFYEYIIQHKIKNMIFTLLNVNLNFFYGLSILFYITSKLSDNKTMSFWENFLVKVVDDFKSKGYNFNQIAELNIITITNKLDMSNDFYIRHNMHAVERKLNAMINKNESLINKLNRNCRHPLIMRFELVPISNQRWKSMKYKHKLLSKVPNNKNA